MIERKIESEGYWREEFAVSEEEVAEIGVLLLEGGRPLAVGELARWLMEERCRREEEWVRRQLTRGKVYRANGEYEVGEVVVFAHLEFAVGEVVGERAGQNPEYGEFRVIEVEMEGDGGRRQYAAELKAEHKLSMREGAWEEAAPGISRAGLYERYGGLVGEKLERRLEREGGFVSFRGLWMAREGLAEVHVGLLNLAEAMLEVEGQPLGSGELLSVMDLPEEIGAEVQEFSLNLGMRGDERFVDVGDAREVVWGLRRWLPEEVVGVPARLRYEGEAYDRRGLDVAHLQLEREIEDEASAVVASPLAAEARRMRLVLSYPHWRHGTLPLTERTRVFFPSGEREQRTRVRIEDREGEVEYEGWVVHEGGYVYGFGEWYERNQIPAGAYIELEVRGEEDRVGVGIVRRRMRREWVRLATRRGGGGLGFEMRKLPVACEYDELCLFGETDREEVDRLWAEEAERGRLLGELLKEVYGELSKLSPGLMVHAKTLYTAVNVVRRSPPGVVFAELFAQPEFVTSGDGYWLYQEGAGATVTSGRGAEVFQGLIG